jgi:hypothetical protein
VGRKSKARRPDRGGLQSRKGTHRRNTNTRSAKQEPRNRTPTPTTPLTHAFFVAPLSITLSNTLPLIPPQLPAALANKARLTLYPSQQHGRKNVIFCRTGSQKLLPEPAPKNAQKTKRGLFKGKYIFYMLNYGLAFDQYCIDDLLNSGLRCDVR